MRASHCAIAILAVLCDAASVDAQASIFPEWAGRDVAVLSGDREGSVGDAEQLFAQSTRAPSGDAFEGAILCRLHVDEPDEGRWDSFADPDLRVVMQAGRTRLTAWGPENSRDAYVSFAGLSVRPRTQLSWRVFDRDVTGDEQIETLTLRFEGVWPWTVRGRHAQLECRAIDAALAASRASDGERAAEAALQTLTAARPNLTEPALGRPPSLYQAQSSIVRIMTYRGARDPSARALNRRIDDATEAFDRALRAAITTAQRSAPGPGTWISTARGGGIRMTALACGARELARLQIEATTTDCAVVLETRGDTHDLRVDVIDANGAVPGIIERTPNGAVVRFPMRVDPRRMLLRVGAPELQVIRLR